ncbi:DUF5131 family protein [Streptomyces sp. NPDC056230]|uniref:DUF5131 family protein n=1 Tax=Streptomyces sp. NPDC056230 TaxID=3345754 RepID=UPI0035DB544B
MHPDEPGTKYCFFSGLDMPRTTEQKNPRTVFVNSMSDLFHARVPLDFVRQAFEVMADTPQRTYQVLTKRARRLRQVAYQLVWPGNLWMGASVETAKELHRLTIWGKYPHRSGSCPVSRSWDRWTGYTSFALAEHLDRAGIAASTGSVGDAYDNALMESTIGLFKTELTKPRRPWKTLSEVELATAEWVDWYCHRRLRGEIGHIPPAEYETNYYRATTKPQVTVTT